MTDLSLKEMQEMQRNLQEKYQKKWGGLYPEKFHTMMLYLFTEAGEAVDVVKKNGHTKVLQDADIRNHFIEEMAPRPLCPFGCRRSELCQHPSPEKNTAHR